MILNCDEFVTLGKKFIQLGYLIDIQIELTYLIHEQLALAYKLLFTFGHFNEVIAINLNQYLNITYKQRLKAKKIKILHILFSSG